MNKEEKIIMFESDEAAQMKTVTGWVSADGRFYGNDERAARYAGSTHSKCECGGMVEKGWTICETCRHKSAQERYLKLPYKDWDGKVPICLYDGDEYFWDEEKLLDYLYDHELNGSEVQLVFCDPVNYQSIDTETVAGDSHEDWEPSKELEEKIAEFNKYLATLPAHSWFPGKVRTSYDYTYKPDDNENT